jgi:hypothetical protein
MQQVQQPEHFVLAHAIPFPASFAFDCMDGVIKYVGNRVQFHIGKNCIPWFVCIFP